MGKNIREMMTRELVKLEAGEPVVEAARRMREEDVGDVLVVNGGRLVGILTDRDIVCRCIAADADPRTTPIEEVCSRELITVSPEDDSDAVVRLMEDKAIRRIPVVADGSPLGILSIGDLAPMTSVLGRISTAPANR